MSRENFFFLRSQIVRIWFCVIVITAFWVPSAIAQADSQSRCTPEFPLAQRWQGADAAYSIPLNDGRVVWIFGDTLYGKKRIVVGEDPRMVHNSIGISTCRNGKWNIRYTIRHGKDKQPLSFFAPENAKTWYWALDGVFHKDALWVTLLCIRSVPKDTSAFGFETCGTDLAKVTNLNANPQNWQVRYFPLVPDGTHAYPSATALIDSSYLYIFAMFEQGTRPMLLTRIPLTGLDNPQQHLQYLAKDNTWKTGFVPSDAKHVMAHGSSEMSVRFHPELKKWVAVLPEPGFLSDKILLRTADNLIGPWSEGEVIYRIPEMQKTSAGYDPDTFCYAAKEHPEFEKPHDLLFTYVCNTMKPEKLMKRTDIYFPQVVRQPMPEQH